MLKRLNLNLAFRHHQPVGNIPAVLERCHQQCYEPLVKAIEAFPALKFSLYYSGPLLEFLLAHHPDFIQRLRLLVQAGRVEMLAGAFYEPILAELNEEDRQGQVRKSLQWMVEHFGTEARGCILAEGVWDQSLVSSLHEAGIDYTVLNHERFMQAGVREANLFGHYMTEHQGRTMALFPNHPSALRLMPYGGLDDLFTFFRRQANRGEDLVLTAVDHAERWGVWRGSREQVLDSGYIHQLFERLSTAGDWLQTTTFSECVDSRRRQGRIYPPTGVNWEMGAWSLANESRNDFFRARQSLEQRHDATHFLPFFQGGSFAGFRLRYPESNSMWSKGRYLRARVEEAGLLEEKTLELLWKAQCNTAYWFASSGGIYLPHLRSAIWENLLRAEELIRREQEDWEIEEEDFDADSDEEILLTHRDIVMRIDPAYGGSCFELSWLPRHVNLSNTLTRRSERIPGTELDAHSRIGRGLDKMPDQVEDWYQRRVFQDHFINRGTTVEDLASMKFVELGDFVNQPFEKVQSTMLPEGVEIVLERAGGLYRNSQRQDVTVRKHYAWLGDPAELYVHYEVINTSKLPLEAVFAIEANFLLSNNQDKPDICLVDSEPQPLNAPWAVARAEGLKIISPVKKMEVELTMQGGLEVLSFPITGYHHADGETQAVRQGNAFFFARHLTIPPEQQADLALTLILRSA